MTVKLGNRVKESTLTSGTESIVLAGAIPGYQAFSSVLSSGDQTFYTIENTPNWEVGVGTFLGGVISRDEVLSSSSGGSKISLSGQSYIFIAYPSERSVRLDSNGAVFAKDGIYLETGVPIGTGNALYNNQGNLYFNGSLIGGSGTAYSAGDGIDLSGTQFSVDGTVARSGDSISIFSNDSRYTVLPAGGTAGQELYKVADTGVDVAWKDNYSVELREVAQNDTASDITRGTLVMSDGASGDTIKIAPAVTNGSVEARYILGLATETIPANGGRGDVTFFGPFKGYDTSLYSVGTVLYNDPNNDGQLSSSVPTSPELSMSVAIVTKVGNSSSGRLFVRMWTQQEGLHELHDVAIDAASSGDGIKYTGSTWVPDSNLIHSGDNVSVLNNDAGYLTSHPSVSAASGSDNSGRTYIQDVFLDQYGHVTELVTATETVVDTDTTYTAGTGLSLVGTEFNIDQTVVQSGDNVSVLNNDAGYLTSHPSVSAASGSDNSGRTYIQDVFLDQYGHVTGLVTATETVVDTDTTYTAGTGLSLVGTEFSIDSSVLQFSDLTSGSITSGTGDIDLSQGSTGDVLTQQSDGSLAMSAPAGGGIGGSTGATDNAVLRADGTDDKTLQGSVATIDDAGNLTAAKLSAVSFVQTNWGWFYRGTTAMMTLDPNRVRVNNFPITGLSQLNWSTPGQVDLQPVAADHLSQHRSTNPQTFSIANTYTSTTSYERLEIGWDTNVATINTTAGSAGGAVRDLHIQNCIKINGQNEAVEEIVFKVYSDATRPAAGTAGRIIYNSDDGNLNIDNGTNWILPDGTTT
jgi:hypothetical protein